MPMRKKKAYERPTISFVEVDIGEQPLALTGNGGGTLPPEIEPEPFGSSKSFRKPFEW